MEGEYYVYILACADNTFYTGITNDLNRRLNEHRAGIHEDSYTFSRRPLVLKRHMTFDDPLDAIRFEKRIKKWSHAKKLALINGDFGRLPPLSRNARNRKELE